MENNITPQVLADHGFKYHSAGISGADMWQGMPWWIHKEEDVGLALRGNTSTAKPKALILAGHFNTQVSTIAQLEVLMEIFGLKINT